MFPKLSMKLNRQCNGLVSVCTAYHSDKKVCQLVKSEADFLSTVIDVECLQPTVKLKFVAG